jgi:hypothetical protein
MIHIYRLTILSTWRNPLVFPLANSPCTRVPLTYLESLLPVWCNPCPPWYQVACKLTSPPIPSPFHFPAPNGSPNSIVRPSKTTSRHRLSTEHKEIENSMLISKIQTCISDKMPLRPSPPKQKKEVRI